jgi:predicted permease
MRHPLYDVLRFTSAAAGPAMLVVLVLRLAGLIRHTDAIIDLVVLLVIGILSPALAVWIGRRTRG